jgi:hypothetical protein
VVRGWLGGGPMVICWWLGDGPVWFSGGSGVTRRWSEVAR